MNDQQSAWVKLYHPSGAQVTIPLPAPKELLDEIYASVSEAIQTGFSVDAPGLGDGETRVAVTGWVRGETADGAPCVYLYGASHLQYRVATVWEEDIEKLPFGDEALVEKPIPGSAPKREFAIKHGVFHEYKGTIILVKVGETEEGSPRYRFVRWVGYEPGNRQVEERKKPDSGPSQLNPSRPYAPETLRAKIGNLVKKYTGEIAEGKRGGVTDATRKVLAASLSKCFESEEERHAAIEYLGWPGGSTKNMDAAWVYALLTWLGNGDPGAVTFQWMPCQTVMEEAKKLAEVAFG